MSNLAVFGGLSDACIKFYPKLEFPFAWGEGGMESILLQNRSLFYPSPSTLSKSDKSDKNFLLLVKRLCITEVISAED